MRILFIYLKNTVFKTVIWKETTF